MRKSIFAVLAIFLLAGCTGAGGGYSGKGINGRYAGELAKQYQSMAAMFGVNGDHKLSLHFQASGAQAEAGIWVNPDPAPEDPDMQDAYDHLLAALTGAMNKENALWLARAQVNYDCWVNTEEETCKRDFNKAMDSISIPVKALQTQSVYFDADSSQLSKETKATLGKVAGIVRMNKSVNLRLVGSTDHTTRNPSLALRRAIAVRNMLTQMGVGSERITVTDESHTDTILSQQNPETGNDAPDRRVDIILEPVFGREI